MNILRNSFYFTFLGLASMATAQVSFQVQVNTGGFSDSEGVPTNLMPFGILVDTGNDGFDVDFYNAFDLSVNGQFLYSSGILSDDLFVFSGSTPPETAFSPSLGDGAIGAFQINDFNDTYAGSPFGIIWFENAAQAGEAYGIAVDESNFVIPSSNTVISQPDAGWIPGSADYTLLAAVPEPNLLGAFLGLGVLSLALVRRRR